MSIIAMIISILGIIGDIFIYHLIEFMVRVL